MGTCQSALTQRATCGLRVSLFFFKSKTLTKTANPGQTEWGTGGSLVGDGGPHGGPMGGMGWGAWAGHGAGAGVLD